MDLRNHSAPWKTINKMIVIVLTEFVSEHRIVLNTSKLNLFRGILK